MTKLLEAEELSEEIITKLAHDYINRYSLKEELTAHQFTNDTTQFIAELQLYSKSVRQVRGMGSSGIALEECLQGNVFKVMQFFVRMIHKLINKGSKSIEDILVDGRCQECCQNMNAKRIEQVRKEMIDHLPILAKSDLEFQEEPNDEYDGGILTQQQIINKIMKLQTNLHEKQLGLMRCIDQFDDFKMNLMVGRPKYSDLELNNMFNVKKYAFQMGVYFSNNLQNIQERINKLRKEVKQTQDVGVQSINFQQIQQEKEVKVMMESTRIKTIKDETEIRRLNQIINKLQENVKVYSIQIKHLSAKMAETDQENVDLRQENFIEKMKVKAQAKTIAKANPLLEGQRKQEGKQQFLSDIPTIEAQIAHEIYTQINARRKDIEDFGIKIEEVIPYIKTTFKKALDSMLKKRTSLIDKKKKKVDDSEDDSSFLLGNSKKNRNSMRGIAPLLPKREVSNRFQAAHFKVEKGQDKKNKYSISSQMSYKIVGIKRKSKGLQPPQGYTHPSNSGASDDKNSVSGSSRQEIRTSKVMYKQSVLATEGNRDLKKRGMHIKLSSIASEVKDSVNPDSDHNVEVLHNKTTQGKFIQSSGHERSESQLLQIGSTEYGEMFEGIGMDLGVGVSEDGEVRHNKRNSKNSVLSMRTESMTGLMKNRGNGTQKVSNLMQIRRIEGSKIISQKVLANFLEPEYQKETHFKTENACVDQKSPQKDMKNGIKNIFNKLKNYEKVDAINGLQGHGSPGKKIYRKEPLNLEEISFMTAFFTLMARSHLENNHLYTQLKKCILEASKENRPEPSKEEALIKVTVGQIITKHRKCRGKKLCSHLNDFLASFQECLE